MTLSKVISNFNERIKKAVGLDVRYEKQSNKLEMGKPESTSWKVISLCSKEEGFDTTCHTLDSSIRNFSPFWMCGVNSLANLPSQCLTKQCK